MENLRAKAREEALEAAKQLEEVRRKNRRIANREISNSVSKVIRDYFGFASFRPVIDPENSHHFINQSDSKLNPIASGY